MERRKPSASDVARRAGVSRTTVSFVLNNTPGKAISEDTRRRVLEAAKKLNYVPDEAARSLALSRQRAVGLFICRRQYTISDAFTISVVEGMATVLNKHRYRLVIVPVPVATDDYVELAEASGLDGIVVINPQSDDQALFRTHSAQFPAVVIGSIDDENIPQVDIDNVDAASLVVRHLVRYGHTRIAMISHAPGNYTAARDRIRGYRMELAKAGIAFCEELLGQGSFTEESGAEAASALLKAEEPPTAIFTGNDTVAYGVYRTAKNLGFRIPQDLSIASIDDDFPSRFLHPPLTSLSVPASSIGAEAARLCIRRVAQPSSPKGVRILIDPYLSERQSCAPPRRDPVSPRL